MTSFDGVEPLEVTIKQGRIFEMRPNFTCDADIDPADIEARVEFRDRALAGVKFASMATEGAGDADGTITITQLAADPDRGIWTYEAYCVLTDTFTQGVNATDYVNPATGALRQAGWGDLKVWSAGVQSGAAFDGGDFEVLIRPEVTA